MFKDCGINAVIKYFLFFLQVAVLREKPLWQAGTDRGFLIFVIMPVIQYEWG